MSAPQGVPTLVRCICPPSGSVIPYLHLPSCRPKGLSLRSIPKPRSHDAGLAVENPSRLPERSHHKHPFP
ncbi:hypothetical protein PspLS_06793 [Pyricularia sp. CBS 133598]|nr:hypothetical protein PspLS_06793 [Pyricularia sp. CBS 133598]